MRGIDPSNLNRVMPAEGTVSFGQTPGASVFPPHQDPLAGGYRMAAELEPRFRDRALHHD